MAFRRRLLILFLIAAGGTAAVFLRLVHLQWVQGDHWEEAARGLREQVERPGAPRGRIVDRDGVPLAEDVPLPRLVLVPWEWQRRVRARCEGCGTIHFFEDSRRPPRRCACGAKGDRMRALPATDLTPLEDLLALTPGTLAAAADSRVARILELAEKHRDRILAEGDDPFVADDRKRSFQDDMLRRPFVVFTGDVSEAALRLLELDGEGRFRGLRLETGLQRRYPQGDAAPQLLGYTQQLFAGEYEQYREAFGHDVTPETRIGRLGLEKGCDGVLRGRGGWRRLGRDDEGAFTVVLAEERPRPGHEVALTTSLAAIRAAEAVLDRYATPEGFAPRGRPSAALVAMDAETGEILAWGEAPRYDVRKDLARLMRPEWNEADFDRERGQWIPRRDLPEGVTEDEWRSEVTKPDPFFLSRVAELPVEPGSTMKPLIALAMLESGRGLPWETFHCTGGSDYPKCHHGGHGSVVLEEAIGLSCNRWFAFALGDSPLTPFYKTAVARYVDRLGFGHVVFADFVGTKGRGLWLRKEKEGEWQEGETPQIGRFEGRFVAIGQGKVTTTPIHLVRAFAALANGGRLVTPHVVGSVGGSRQAFPETDLGLTQETIRRLRAGMRMVVTRGTAADVAWGRVPATVYGKTGTAQVGGVYDPENLDGGPWHHWFVGFAESPGRRTVAFACLLYARTEPAAGGTAAPAVAEFLQWWFARGEE